MERAGGRGGKTGSINLQKNENHFLLMVRTPSEPASRYRRPTVEDVMGEMFRVELSALISHDWRHLSAILRRNHDNEHTVLCY